MSNFSKFLNKKSGGLMPEIKIDSADDVLKVVQLIPADMRNQAADYLFNQSGVDIADTLDRLTPARQMEVMAWALAKGTKKK